MGLEYSPKAITNGLQLYLDAADVNSYTIGILPPVEVLVVAGGGGGGMDMGGGGGGGGVIYSNSYSITSVTPITVTVGAGGWGAPAGGGGYRGDGAGPQPNFHQFTISATNGGNSVFGSLTAIGGGFGASSYYGYQPNYGTPSAGGSGGGASGYSNGNQIPGGTGTQGQGFDGGQGGGQYYSGGGGGAGGAGVSSTAVPHGGVGIQNSILGTNYYWAGGGGGASYSLSTGGNGGLGGGGGGALGTTTGGAGYNNGQPGGGGYPNSQTNKPGGDAGANTGGGGGGGSHYNLTNQGGNGGSGIVVVRYQGPQAATGGTVTSSNGYTIHTFTTSGTFTPNVWCDISNNGRSGTLVNGPTFSTNNGGYFIFDGVDDYVSNISNSGLGHGTNGFSYFAWVNLQGKPSLGTIFENGTWGNCLLIRYETNGITIYSMGSYWGKFSFNPSLSTWNHLGFIRNGNNLEFYVNGVYQSYMNFTANVSPSPNIFIGTSQHSVGQCFNGYIAVAQIYTRTLSSSEVSQNYQMLKSRFGL